MAVLKAIVSLYRAGEKKPIERRKTRVKVTQENKLFSSFQFLGLNEQAQEFGLGSFALKFYRLTKINRKAENYAISTQQQLELELPFLLGSNRESELSGKKSVIWIKMDYVCLVYRSLLWIRESDWLYYRSLSADGQQLHVWLYTWSFFSTLRVQWIKACFFYFLFFKCFSDVFRVGVWPDPSWLEDPELSNLTPDLTELQLSSLLPQFQNMYLAAMSKTGDAVIPAHPLQYSHSRKSLDVPFITTWTTCFRFALMLLAFKVPRGRHRAFYSPRLAYFTLFSQVHS